MLTICCRKLVRHSSYTSLQRKLDDLRDYQLASLIKKKYIPVFFEQLGNSKSQLRQDLFVLSELDFKVDGYFVEFGATDGIRWSNSYLLESSYNWRGILAEPAKLWHEALTLNRNAHIEKNCVWSETGKKLLFNEVNDPKHLGELSTIDTFSSADQHRMTRSSDNNKYEVSTISLNDMLNKYEAPRAIDYLSIDTEGSEYDILSTFDFDKYDIKIITCEHNFTSMREKIYNLLTQKGYLRKYEEVSYFDDWYVKK